MTEKVLLAIVGAPHGTRGEVRIKTYTEDVDSLLDYRQVETEDGQILTIESLRPAGEVVIVRLSGVDDRNKAEALKNQRLYVSRELLPQVEEEETWYQADLVGLEVRTADGTLLGTVKAVVNYGAGDLLDVAVAEGPSVLLPFTRAFVPTVDIAARRIVADPPAGLFGED